MAAESFDYFQTDAVDGRSLGGWLARVALIDVGEFDASAGGCLHPRGHLPPLRTGRRVLVTSRHQRLADFHRFLRWLRHGVGACGALWLLLDRHGSHQSLSSLHLAAKLGIRLFWLSRQYPKLNPVDHLWRGLKNNLAASRQFAGVDELAAYAESWVRTLTPTATLRKAGLLSQNCWLKELRKTL